MWISATLQLRPRLPQSLRRTLPRIASALKPLRRSWAADFGVPPEPIGQLCGTLGLGREPGQRRLDGFGLDAPASQVEANRSVTLPAAREDLRAGDREAAVVDVADLLEPVERLGSFGFAHPGLRKPLVELGPRAVVVAQRAGCDLDRIGIR